LVVNKHGNVLKLYRLSYVKFVCVLMQLKKPLRNVARCSVMNVKHASLGIIVVVC